MIIIMKHENRTKCLQIKTNRTDLTPLNGEFGRLKNKNRLKKRNKEYIESDQFVSTVNSEQ